MENDVRLLLDDLDRCPFSVAGKGAARNRPDDEGKELFHGAEGIRTVEFVISPGRPAHIKSNE